MRRKWNSKTIAVAVCLVMLISMLGLPAYAKGPEVSAAGGTLTGKVTDAATNKGIAGALITASNDTGSYSAVTNSRGSYTMDMPAGDYNVSCEASGYNTVYNFAAIRDGVRTTLLFTLTPAAVTTGTLTGTVTGSDGVPVAGAVVATSTGGYSAVADAAGTYLISDVTAGTYDVTASAAGYSSQTGQITIEAGAAAVCSFILEPLVEAGISIASLTATPDSFAEGTAGSVSLSAVIEGTASAYEWTQVAGPKVPLVSTNEFSAVVDVSTLAVAAEAEMVFRLSVTDSEGSSDSREVTVYVQPADMLPFLGENVQIGGSSTAVAKFSFNGADWCLFNIGSALRATPVAAAEGPVYTVILPGTAYDIEVVNVLKRTYAVVAAGNAGVSVVDITDPTMMSLKYTAPVNYYQTGVTFSDTGGTIWYDNVIASSTAPIVAVEFDGINFYLADYAYGIHKTALSSLFDPLAGPEPFPVLEGDGTLWIDQEVYTLQWAGEKPWGGPISLKLFGNKLFASMGALGMGIFDPVTMTQAGRYNLYTDVVRTEDFFGAMDISQAVSSDPDTGDFYLDDFTGMPDYRQVSYEVYDVMKGNLTGIPTPWADFEREGKWYYNAQDVDVALQGDRTIAYVGCALGGVIAVDVTGFESAASTEFMNAAYLGYFPAVPVNGPYETGSQPSSLLPYEGAGMLKESGVTGVRVNGDKVYLTDHFAGLVILDKAATPDIDWHGPVLPYSNDTNGIPGDNVPDFEDITSYDMSPWDLLDNESLPWCFYQSPCQLATKELNGHGYTLMLNQEPTLTTAGDVDVLECSGAGGFVFVDITDIVAVNMADRFNIVAYFPTTDEIGAAPDGTPTQAIAIGHADSVSASDNYIYVSDGPHGVFAFNITDSEGYMTDDIHLVANTVQDEYPVTVGTEIIYPPSHNVRNVLDPADGKTWALCNGNGMRGVPVNDVEDGLGTVGEPLLLKLYRDDCFEHNSDEFSLKELSYQDAAFDMELRGSYAYVADGSNGITIYDITKDPSVRNSGFFVANIGKVKGEPMLGTASGIELWSNPATGRLYAVIACGPYGVGVVDITDPNNMQIVKVFEPIKIEDGDVAVADGQAIDVEVIGDRAYFSYDSFGVVCYTLADLIAPLPEGVDPTNLFLKNTYGTVIYDYRPEAAGRFKLQEIPGYETVDGGAIKMAYTSQNGRLYLYAAFGAAGLIKLDYTDPAAPELLARMDTAAECNSVAISNGRIYCSDHGGGLVFFK